jgi:hypothetical protein
MSFVLFKLSRIYPGVLVQKEQHGIRTEYEPEATLTAFSDVSFKITALRPILKIAAAL